MPDSKGPTERLWAPRGGVALVVCSGAALAFGVRRPLRRVTARRTRGWLAVRAASAEPVAAEAKTKQASKRELRKLFDSVAAGRELVSFETARQLPKIRELVKAGILGVGELQGFWGDEETDLAFEAFENWYLNATSYADELKQEGEYVETVTHTTMDFADPLRRFTDEDLLTDMPTKVDLKELDRNEDQGAATAKKKQVEKVSRTNAEITQLFRERCSGDNMLSFEGLAKISEVKKLLSDGDIAEEELKDIWHAVPKAGNRRTDIDILAFREILKKIDELFEFFEEDEAEEEKEYVDAEETKAKLNSLLDKLVKEEELPIGFEPCQAKDTDEKLKQMAEDLEDVWYEKHTPLRKVDPKMFCGEWKLIYTTSNKTRRWRTVFNGAEEVKDVDFKEVCVNYSIQDDGINYDCDSEEILVHKETGEEVGIRMEGSWVISEQPNVFSGESDLKLETRFTADWEADLPNGDVKIFEAKSHCSVVARIMFNSFICYSDEDIRITRAGYVTENLFFWRRVKDEEDDD